MSEKQIKKKDSDVNDPLDHGGPRRPFCKQSRQVGKAKQQASYFSLTTRAAPCVSINHVKQRHGPYRKDAAISRLEQVQASDPSQVKSKCHTGKGAMCSKC